jgi:hypothetical protein
MLNDVTVLHEDNNAFDYSELDPALAQEAKDVAQRIHDRRTKAVIETGRDLAYIKKRLKRGVFGKWLNAEFAMTQRTAQNYMLAADVFEGKYEMISYLPPTLLYDLAPLAPVREALLEQLEAGERPHPKIIEEIVRRAKQERRQGRETERASAQHLRESKARGETCRTVAIEGCRQDTQAGQPDCRANDVAGDIRAAADIIVHGLGQELPRLLEVLGEHASITGQDLIAASARASRPRDLSEAHAKAAAGRHSRRFEPQARWPRE